MSLPLIGIIANPSSGRDIRRLVAQGTVFDNNEKTAIVRRMLLGLEAVGISRVAYMPEHDFGIVPRAISELGEALRNMVIEPLAMPVFATAADSTRAARMLTEAGASCIITMGGDGTNRAVAKGCDAVPLVPISTGTNNVFPTFIEGTIAGLAAGLVALGHAGSASVRQAPRLDVLIDGSPIDMALVDVVVSSLPFVGSRAIWDLSVVREVVLSRVGPATIGLSALGGALLDGSFDSSEHVGMHITLGDDGRQVLVPLAPGLVSWVGISSHRRIGIHDVVRCQSGVGTIALDGEREIELTATAVIEVRYSNNGPFVVDVPAALAGAAYAGYLQRERR